MKRPVVIALIMALAIGCGSSGGTGDSGLVQVATFVVSPSAVECGVTLTTPLSENASPDTVAIRAELVNTTASAVTLQAAGVSGIVTISSPDTADVGKMEINYSSIPFTPNPATSRATDGDLNVIISLPIQPLCNLKPPNFGGSQDIQITARLTTNSGLYVTTPTTLRVTWVTL